MRAEVAAFAEAMEAKLRENDHKGGWKECTLAYLVTRLREEVTELARALSSRAGTEDGTGYAGIVTREAADVANFAMMIADACGGLGPALPGQEGPSSAREGMEQRADSAPETGTLGRPTR